LPQIKIYAPPPPVKSSAYRYSPTFSSLSLSLPPSLPPSVSKG
jgi:hypothetical protein